MSFELGGCYCWACYSWEALPSLDGATVCVLWSQDRDARTQRTAGVCALIPSDGNVQARLVPSSKPSTAPKVTGGCRGLTCSCRAFQLGPTEDCTGLTQDGEICSPWKHSQRDCDREVRGGGTGSRRQSRPDFWLCSQPCRAEGHSQGLRVYSLGSCCLLLLPEVHLGPGLPDVQPLLAGSVLRV